MGDAEIKYCPIEIKMTKKLNEKLRDITINISP